MLGRSHWQSQALLKKQMVFKNKLTQVQVQVQVCYGEKLLRTRCRCAVGKEGFLQGENWQWGAERQWWSWTAEICWEDVVSDRTKMWWLTQPRASHSCAGLLLLLKVPQVSRIKSKGRQRWKNSDKTFVLISLELTMFIKPPPASGWDCILLRIEDAIFKTCLAFFVQDIPFK